ncbi:hypothetical protein ACWKSP_00230 [Micromonosporaceae bacterium Da 78-11]
MISPQGQNQKYLDDFAGRVDHGTGVARPAPSGNTVWWAVKALAVVAATVFGCVGFAGVAQSAGLRCHDVSHRACLAMVVDDLTGKTEPARAAD